VLASDLVLAGAPDTVLRGATEAVLDTIRSL
jgi:hypothetical protein